MGESRVVLLMPVEEEGEGEGEGVEGRIPQPREGVTGGGGKQLFPLLPLIPLLLIFQ